MCWRAPDITRSGTISSSLVITNQSIEAWMHTNTLSMQIQRQIQGKIKRNTTPKAKQMNLDEESTVFKLYSFFPVCEWIYSTKPSFTQFASQHVKESSTHLQVNFPSSWSLYLAMYHPPPLNIQLHHNRRRSLGEVCRICHNTSEGQAWFTELRGCPCPYIT